MKGDYIEYRIKRTPIVWEQRIDEDLVDKLFITIDGKVPYFRTIYDWHAKNIYGTFYKFKLPVLRAIIYDIELKLWFERRLICNEKLY